MYLTNDNRMKQLSFEDNVYFTLRDIFANAASTHISLSANELNNCLTNGIYFEERTNNFTYTNALYDINYIQRLLVFLNNFRPIMFGFLEQRKDEQIDQRRYMKFEEWWQQFDMLRKKIAHHYDKLQYAGEIKT